MRLALLILTLITSSAVGQSIVDFGAERPQRIVVTIGESLPELAKAGESDMTRLLKGALADLRGKPLDELRACFPANPMLGDPNGAEPVCTLHLFGAAGSRTLAIVRAKDGAIVAIEQAPAGHPRRAELRRERFETLFAAWPQFRGSFDPDSLKDPRGEVFELAKPYVPSRITLDQKTLGDRFLHGTKTSLPGADRVLDQERLYCRLPKGYTPRSPAGLVVWVDPSSSGRPPQPLWAALDELNLICIGAADSGNNRLVSNREQLALDSVSTAMRRYHVDPRRVYITGMSGGGRVSSMMLAGFPDIFTGAVPIVGLSTYQRVPDGAGHFWPRGYEKPRTEIFNQFLTRRMAAVTGSRDFNQIEMQHGADIMKRDRVQIRLYDYDHMGHEMPTPERFREAIMWVDEIYQDERAKETEAAAKAMAAYAARFGQSAPADEAARKLLVRVTESGPWTTEAWTALGLLGR